MMGVLCGATTNTPALGAAQQTLQQMHLPSAGAALSCAVTYPLGLIGVILAIVIMKPLLYKRQSPAADLHNDDEASSAPTRSATPPSTEKASTT